MSDSDLEGRYRAVCDLQQAIRAHLPGAQEVPNGHAVPYMSVGTAPQAKVQDLLDLEARTKELIPNRYRALRPSPGKPGMTWDQYHDRLELLLCALEQEGQEILRSAPGG